MWSNIDIVVIIQYVVVISSDYLHIDYINILEFNVTHSDIVHCLKVRIIFNNIFPVIGEHVRLPLLLGKSSGVESFQVKSHQVELS